MALMTEKKKLELLYRQFEKTIPEKERQYFSYFAWHFDITKALFCAQFHEPMVMKANFFKAQVGSAGLIHIDQDKVARFMQKNDILQIPLIVVNFLLDQDEQVSAYKLLIDGWHRLIAHNRQRTLPNYVSLSPVETEWIMRR